MINKTEGTDFYLLCGCCVVSFSTRACIISFKAAIENGDLDYSVRIFKKDIAFHTKVSVSVVLRV